MIEAVIFDFDGTILDTESTEYESWCEVYEAHGCQLCRETYAASIGMGTDYNTYDPYGDLEALLGRQIDRESVRDSRRTRHQEMIAQSAVLPGVQQWIDDVKGHGLKLGLASSSHRDWLERHLTRFDLLNHFDCIRGADDVARTKPDPELYLSVLAEFGIPAARAVAIEDSANGVRAAKAAGLFVIAVPNPLTACLEFPDANLRIESLGEMRLHDLLARLNEVPGAW